jgi:hypothetical protein
MFLLQHVGGYVAASVLANRFVVVVGYVCESVLVCYASHTCLYSGGPSFDVDPPVGTNIIEVF